MSEIYLLYDYDEVVKFLHNDDTGLITHILLIHIPTYTGYSEEPGFEKLVMEEDDQLFFKLDNKDTELRLCNKLNYVLTFMPGFLEPGEYCLTQGPMEAILSRKKEGL